MNSLAAEDSHRLLIEAPQLQPGIKCESLHLHTILSVKLGIIQQCLCGEHNRPANLLDLLLSEL